MKSGAIIFLIFAFIPTVRAQEKCDNCSVPSLASPEKPKAEDPRSEEVKRLDAELDAADLRGDRAFLANTLADGMIAVGAAGDITARDRLIAHVSPAPPARKLSITAADVQATLFGDTAIVTSKKTRRWETRGRPGSRDYRETNTYVRRGDRWLLISSQTSEEPPPYSAKDVAFDLPFDAAQALGDRNTTIVLYEFSDYQCAFCRMFAAQTLPSVQREFIATGPVAFVFRDNPQEDSHPRAFAAATAAQCAAAAGRFREMNERLLRDPVELSDEALARDAREIGVDPASFQRCIGDPATAQKIRAEMKEADRVGVRGTPIFVIGVRKPDASTVRAVRMIEGAFPYEVFKTTIDSVIRSRNF